VHLREKENRNMALPRMTLPKKRAITRAQRREAGRLTYLTSGPKFGALFDDPFIEEKIKAAFERKIFSFADINVAVGLLMFPFEVKAVSLKHCPDDHEANMSRRSTATKEQLAELKDTLRNAITIE
jgi:hypothetical protein